MSGECSRNGQYKGIIHYKLGVVFYLESLLFIHYIIPAMKYFSVYRDCMGPSVLPSPFNFKGCLAEKWLWQNGSSYSQQQDSQEGRNSTLTFMCPDLVVCHFCTAAQLQVCSWVSTWSMYYLMVMPQNRRRKPKVNVKIVGWLCGLTPLTNWTRGVWKPQRNYQVDLHSVISLSLLYLSSIRRAEVHFQVTHHYFLDILCHLKLPQEVQELVMYFRR